MVGVGVPRQAQLLRIAQRADVRGRGRRIVGPLATGLVGVANCDVRDGSVGLIPPLDTRLGVDLGVGVGTDQGVEQSVYGQGSGRVAQRGQEVGVQVRGEVQQTGLSGELLVQQLVMMAAEVVGDVAVQDVREDQSRRAVS